MQFTRPLIRGRLLKRYKRFLADVVLEDGEQITAHCANPGAMLGLKAEGSTVWLSRSDNPKRKLAYSWELVDVDGTLVGINTAHPNGLVEQAVRDGTIAELRDYQSLRREVKYGRNSRIDLLLEADGRRACYVEVKNVHLLRQPGRAEFPDSVTKRGTKHLAELADMVAAGHRAVMVYVVQRADAREFALARDIDPAYAQAFDTAQRQGVESLAYCCAVSPQGIEVRDRIPFLSE